jgi:hypothetical protein
LQTINTMSKYAFLSTLAIALALASCEEVIVLDLEEAASKTIIEANLDARAGFCTVKLSRSAGFYAPNAFEAIAEAAVRLSIAGGQTYPLTEVQPGQYAASGIDVAPGDSAYLSVVVGEAVYEAAALTPRQAPLMTLSAELLEEEATPVGHSGENAYRLTVKWTDPLSTADSDYYRIQINRNGAYLSDLYLMADDRLGDGVLMVRPILRQNFSKGDVLNVRLLSVNEDYHRYFSDIANAQGGGFSATATPYNPASAFGDDAVLGYFGVWQATEAMLTVE